MGRININNDDGKPEVYPEEFFELKTKVKNGTATSSEKTVFQEKRAELVKRLQWYSDAQLFDVELASYSTSSGSKKIKSKSSQRSSGESTAADTAANSEVAEEQHIDSTGNKSIMENRIKIKDISNHWARQSIDGI